MLTDKQLARRRRLKANRVDAARRVREHQARRSARAKAAGLGEMATTRLYLPGNVATRIREIAARHNVPLAVVISAILEIGTPLLSPARLEAFWARHRGIIGAEARHNVASWLKVRQAWKDKCSVESKRAAMAGQIDSGIALPVPPPVAADG